MSLAPDLQACTDTQGLVGEDEGEDEDPSEMSPSNSLALNRTKTNVNMGGLERILNGETSHAAQKTAIEGSGYFSTSVIVLCQMSRVFKRALGANSINAPFKYFRVFYIIGARDTVKKTETRSGLNPYFIRQSQWNKFCVNNSKV